MSRKDDAFLKQARDRFEQGQEATAKQRKRELSDLAFYAGGENQWDAETLQARKAQTATGTMPPVPARPCITINKMREPVHQVLNQERQSEMTIALVAADDFAALGAPINDDEIELREGLIRRIQRNSEAQDARTWAFTRAVISGTGYYIVRTRYLPGQTWDQELYVDRIYNQAAVNLDPSHEQPDGSDCNWEFVGADLPLPQFSAEFRQTSKEAEEIADASDDDFRALGDEYPGWFSGEGETKAVRVTEYFYTEMTPRTLVRLIDGSSHWKDELPEGHAAIKDERTEVEKKIKWAKITANLILEETDWPGPDMPIIKVLGEELPPYDGERRSEGMVRPARGAQEGYNAMVSKWVETVGLAPIPPFQVWEGQTTGYEQWYQAANTRTLPYLPARMVSPETGAPFPSLPQRMNVDVPIQAIAASVQMFDEGIKSTTMVPSVQLGQQTDQRLKSGRAIKLMQDQAVLGTSNLLDNLRRSERYEGKVTNNLLYPIYGKTPGRIVRILNGTGETETRHIAAADAAAQPAAMGQQGPKQVALTPDANFNVVVRITRGFDTRRAEEASTVGSLIEANPALMSIFGDLFLKNQDGPAHLEMAERMGVMLDPKVQQFIESKKAGGAPAVPPQVQAQMQQLQGRLQQAEGILAQAKHELESNAQEKQMELQAKAQIADADRAWEKEKLEKELAAKIEIARISAAKQTADLEREAAEESLALGAKLTHEATQAELDRAHKTQESESQRQHQTALAAAQAAPRSIAIQRGPDGALSGAQVTTAGPERPQ